MAVTEGVKIYRRSSTSVTPVDLIIVGGQSNAEGRGSSGSSPSVSVGLYTTGGGVSNLADPVGDADTGSAWPSFANQWYTETGRPCVIAELADGGSGIIPDSSGDNWSPSGDLRGELVAAASTALATLPKYNYSVNSINIVWSQGEYEANNINGSTITAALYETALESLADYFKANIPSLNKIYVIRTGALNNGSDAANYTSIRDAQDNACSNNDNLVMAYTNTVNFPALGYMTDNVHYDQTGLNIIGEAVATFINT